MLLGAAVFLFPYLQKALEVDNSLMVWFLEEDPALEPYHEFQQHFGNDEVVIMVYNRKEGLLNTAELKKLRAFSDSLIKSEDIAGLIGVGNARTVSSGTFNSTTRALIPKGDFTVIEVEQALRENPFLRDQLFNEDYTTTRLIIQPRQSADFDKRRGDILNYIYSTALHYLPSEQTYFGGIGVIYQGLNQLSKTDFSRFLGLGYLMMFILIWLIYHRLIYVIYAVGTIAFSTYYTLGIYGLLGYRLNLMSALIPMIIILLCIMDVMHILNEKGKLSKEYKGDELVRKSLAGVWKPCLFTTLTTMAGFLSLLVSPMAVLKEFGAFSALGIALGLFFSYLLGAALLPKVRNGRAQINTSKRLLSLESFIMRYKKQVSAGLIALVGLAVWGTWRIVTDTFTIGYFPEDHSVYQDSENIEKHWGYYMPLDILVYPADSLDMRSPVVLERLSHFSDSLEQLSGIAEVRSYHSLYKGPLEERYGDKWQEKLYSKTLTKNIARRSEQYYPELVRHFATPDYSLGRLYLTSKMTTARGLTAKMDSIKSIASRVLGETASIKPSGYQSLYAGIVNYITQSQINSFAMAVLLIFLLVWLFLKDLRLSLISLLPNFFPVFFMLGFMGWAGIYLDSATASIAAIVLSFSIDDTIHFVYHYRKSKREGYTSGEARRLTIMHVGRAIVLTSTVLFFGYILMVFGELKSVVYFGLLTAIAIAGALFSQLVIFPLLLARFDR